MSKCADLEIPPPVQPSSHMEEGGRDGYEVQSFRSQCDRQVVVSVKDGYLNIGVRCVSLVLDGINFDVWLTYMYLASMCRPFVSAL